MARRTKRKSMKAPARVVKRTAADPHPRLVAAGGFTRRDLWAFTGVFVVALAVRLLYFVINERNNPLFYHPVLDALFHHEWARSIAGGDFWGNEVFFRAPLYPYCLALVYRLSSDSIAAAVLAQHVLGALSAALVCLLTRLYFTPTVALVAGAFAALYWPLIFFEGDLLIVTFIVFLDLATLIMLTVSIRSTRRSWLALSGILLGLSAIARPSILIFAPFIPLAFYASGCARKTGPSASPHDWLLRSALVLAGLAAVVAPVTVRNWVVGRDFVLIASQGGVNFYIGNNPQSNGTQAIVPGARGDLYGTYQGAIELAERDAGRRLKPSEVSDYYFRKGLDFVVFSPGEAATLYAKKLYFFWAAVERSNNRYIQFFWDRFGLGKIPLPSFGFVGPLALLGALLSWRRRRELPLLYLFVVTYMVGVVAFFVNARFRLPVVPVLIVFAAYAVVYLVYAARMNRPAFVSALGGLLVFAVVVNYDYANFRGVRSFDIAVTHYELANAYLQLGDKEKALEAFEAARATQERYPTRGYSQISDAIDYNLGLLYREHVRYAEAITALERIGDDNEWTVTARRVLADCYNRVGRKQDARSLLEKLHAEHPDDPQIEAEWRALEAP